MSYNVRSLRDDRDAVGRVIRVARPDVVCVQEAPRFLRWRSLCAGLARSAGLVVVGGGRAAAANLVLSTLAVDVLATSDVLFSAQPRLHQRGTAIAVLRKGPTTFAVAGTHLDLEQAARLRHVGELHAAIADAVPDGVPCLVAGDTNDVPGSPVWQQLTASRNDAWALAGSGDGFTSTATDPHQRIDGLFVPPGLRIRSVEVAYGPDVRAASDHCPVIAEFDLP